MFNPDDAKRISLRESSLADDVRRRDSDPTLGLSSLLARTTTFGTYPSTPRCFFACQPLTLLGAEVEGGAGSVSADSAPFLALNIGSAVPPSGTQVLATRVESRWVFRYDA